MLIDINESESWRKSLGKPSQNLRSGDIELILRSFALLQNQDNYAPKMVTFLNDFSKESKKFKAKHVEYLRDLFASFIDTCSLLEEKVFYRNSRFSKTLFKSVFVAVCKRYFSTLSLVSGKI